MLLLTEKRDLAPQIYKPGRIFKPTTLIITGMKHKSPITVNMNNSIADDEFG